MTESTLTPNRWTITRKAAVVPELLRGGEAAEMARSHGLSQVQLFLWRDRFLDGGQVALRTRRGQLDAERERHVRELKRKVGQLTLENEILKNRRADPPTWAEVDQLRAQGAPLSLVCRTLGVSRAGFYNWQHGSVPTPPQLAPCDERLAQRIRSILDREETFGYRRVWAWLRFQEGVRVNRKTVHRVMQLQGWQCRLWHRPALRPSRHG